MIRVAVSGAAGRMGREVVAAVLAEPDLRLSMAIDISRVGEDAGVVAGVDPCGGRVSGWPDTEALRRTADVLVDFTGPQSAAGNTLAALEAGVSPVVGTTGISADDLERIGAVADRGNIGAVIAPNFAIGAVLMMRFAELAAPLMSDVEIIELHHPGKLDAPSGTAKLTAERVQKALPQGARAPIPIHSVRLPGLVAHQEVIFGALGQTLTIRHDSMDRKSFMPGVILAIRRVRDLDGLVIGLDRLLGIS